METIIVNKDIRVFYVTAKSFPEGVMEAWNKLHTLIRSSETRTYYGLSRPEKDMIVYKAAVEESYPGEAVNTNSETLIIKSGKYIASVIPDYMKAMHKFREVFQELLSTPGLDPDGYCIEWYYNEKDVKCMVRLRN